MVDAPMLKTTPLVVCALALPMIVWQAVSAQSKDGFSQIRVPMDGTFTESFSLLVIGAVLMGASSLASRVLPTKPSLESAARRSAAGQSLGRASSS
jgi:hypothetical protein